MLIYIGDWAKCPFWSMQKGGEYVCGKDECEFFRAKDAVCILKKSCGCSGKDAKVKLTLQEQEMGY